MTAISPRRPIRTGFISWAHDDASLVTALLHLLKSRLSIRTEYELNVWWDRQLIVGRPWKGQILDQIDRVAFGLMFVSNAFLASGFIRREEVRPLVADRRAFPVLLEAVPLENVTTHGLAELEIYHWGPYGTFPDRSFAETGGNNRRAFADGIVEELIRFLRQVDDEAGRGTL